MASFLTNSNHQAEAIVMIHGLGGHRLVMLPLSQRLRRKGYRVTNWGYASLRKNIRSHALDFQRTVRDLDHNPHIDTLHIVAHSMGCIITRVLLQDYLPTKLKRIVMMCPPNRGSHVATAMAPFLGWLSPPLKEIADTPDSFVNSLSTSISGNIEVGIIRAQLDLVVAAESASLPGVTDTIELGGLHSSLLLSAETAEAIDHFLRLGAFCGKST